MSGDEPTHEALAWMEALLEVTRAQLRAAKRLDGAMLADYTAQRNDALFQLRVAMAEEVPRDVLLQLRERAVELAALDDRLSRVASGVLFTLGTVGAGSNEPGTYDALGRMAG